MEKGSPSLRRTVDGPTLAPVRQHRIPRLLACLIAVAVLLNLHWHTSTRLGLDAAPVVHPSAIKCRNLRAVPGPPPHFAKRTHSDRFEEGTPSVWLRNATIWTGRADGKETIFGDLLLQNGIIKAVGALSPAHIAKHSPNSFTEVDLQGAWMTPGIVDVHSHMGNEPSPVLIGASDGNSLKGLTLPYLRSVDAINTHDTSYQHSMSGGITTSLILPGSADGIGGQAFVIKLRPTSARSTSAMLVEPPYGLNGSEVDVESPPRWRHIKHACGENPARVYDGTRMDTVWAQRSIYNEARILRDKQDEYCAKVDAGVVVSEPFPDDLRLEALVDVLRGKVKVQTHCYEAVDLDAFVRMSNEFKFPVAAFHHAHEAYLVPEVLKKAYGKPPAIAMFAAFSRYKREAYRHSEFAPRVLADDGLKVVMKSDHSAIQSRYLLHEAQQAHYWGLPAHTALKSVTVHSAEVLGLDHRIGYIREGYDADVVVWDSNPLALGATPKQVYIDGIAQFPEPHVVEKPKAQQKPPVTPNFDREVNATLKHEGLPPLDPDTLTHDVVFTNISHMWSRQGSRLVDALRTPATQNGVAFVREGRIVCSGAQSNCDAYIASSNRVTHVDLRGGSLSPALVSYGSSLGLQEIAMEPSTTDGTVSEGPIFGGSRITEGIIPKAVDGLQFQSRNALLAYRAGITTAIVAPVAGMVSAGLSTAFSLSAAHKLERGAVIKDVVAFHVAIWHTFTGVPSVSSQIAALRKALMQESKGEVGVWTQQVREATIPLVVEVRNADIMATLIKLKREVEDHVGHSIKMTFTGAAEAHLLAKELAAANIGVIVTPPRSFPYTWEEQRIAYGPPVHAKGPVAILAEHGVDVAIGPQGLSGMAQMSGWAVRNLRFDAGWLTLDSGGAIGMDEALSMASFNVERLLGIENDGTDADIVATEGGELLSFEGKVVGVISSRRGNVHVF